MDPTRDVPFTIRLSLLVYMLCASKFPPPTPPPIYTLLKLHRLKTHCRIWKSAVNFGTIITQYTAGRQLTFNTSSH